MSRSIAANPDLVDRVVRDVRSQVGDLLPEDVLREYAQVALAELGDARIGTFVPLLAAQAVLARCRAQTHTWTPRQHVDRDAITILFVCIHNSGRSVMAAAFFNQLVAERELAARARSAGTHPSSQVNPTVATAMAEVGLDIRAYQPQLLTEALVSSSDYLIAMGCALDTTSCPASWMTEVEDWRLEDPHGQSLLEVRQIREQVRQRVSALVDRLASGPNPRTMLPQA